MQYTTFNTTAFTHGITESLDQTVAQPSAWLITTLTSKQAQAKYALMLEMGQRLAEIARLIILATIATINEYVAECERPTIAPISPPQQEEEIAVEEISVHASAARTMPKMASVVVPVKKPISEMTRDELRALCTERKIRWNRANGGKHLSVSQMRAALQK